MNVPPSTETIECPPSPTHISKPVGEIIFITLSLCDIENAFKVSWSRQTSIGPKKDASMLSKTPTSIRTQLTYLLFFSVLPLWLVSGLLIHHLYRAKCYEVNKDMLDTSRFMTMVVDRELSNVRAALNALATSPQFRNKDLRSLHSQILQLLKSYPGAEIIVADATGQQLLNSARPYGTPLPKRNSPTVRRIFETIKPVTSDLYYGAITKQPRIGIDVPVMHDGKVVYDLAMTFPPDGMQAVLQQKRLPDQWYSSILDSKNVFVACSHKPGESVGSSVNDKLLRALSLSSEGTTEGVNFEGKSVFVSFCRSEISGWKMVIAVPKAAVMHEIYLWIGWAVIGVTAVTLFGLALAMSYSKTIAKAIKSLVDPSLSMGGGKVAIPQEANAIKETREVAALQVSLTQARKQARNELITVNDTLRKEVLEHRLAQEKIVALNAGLDQRVKERTAELEEAIREQEAFSYSVSHDLRAPLRHINSYSAMMIEDHGENLNSDARNYMDRICAASSRMGKMIDHLLELSRMSRTEIRLDSVNLSNLATQVLEMYQQTCPQRCVETTVMGGITVWGDALLLRVLLENLIGNAWKYTSKTASAHIAFGVTVEADREVFFVRDNGAGFDMDYKHKLFGTFERLHGSEFEGVGIGLATSQRIIKRHGGKIWAEGSVGQGATIYFTIPATSTTAA